MDILLTLNRNYLRIALIMLFSLWKNNSDEKIRVFVISRDLEMSDFNPLRESGMEFSLIRPSMNLESAITTKRYPEEMYYRLFAFSILPESVDKVLYLDPDIIDHDFPALSLDCLTFPGKFIKLLPADLES